MTFMGGLGNLFGHVSASAKAREELIECVLSAPSLRIERIVSWGNVSPEGFWYDQDTNEWVVLLSGAARLAIEGSEAIDMRTGDYINIPARKRHRVEWTDPDRPSIWLAIHYGEIPLLDTNPVSS
jgi:cupin 2 domain-containing protein